MHTHSLRDSLPKCCSSQLFRYTTPVVTVAIAVLGSFALAGFLHPAGAFSALGSIFGKTGSILMLTSGSVLTGLVISILRPRPSSSKVSSRAAPKQTSDEFSSYDPLIRDLLVERRQENFNNGEMRGGRQSPHHEVYAFGQWYGVNKLIFFYEVEGDPLSQEFHENLIRKLCEAFSEIEKGSGDVKKVEIAMKKEFIALCNQRFSTSFMNATESIKATKERLNRYVESVENIHFVMQGLLRDAGKTWEDLRSVSHEFQMRWETTVFALALSAKGDETSKAVVLKRLSIQSSV